MIYLVYFLAILGVIFILFWLGKITAKAKKELINEPRTFNNAVELMGFIRNVFKCEIEHKTVIYGFVESAYKSDFLLREGLADDEYLEVTVIIITQKGHEKIEAICGNKDAYLSKGDFVAVLPIYYERQNAWTYSLIAKLNTIYLGGEQGFSAQEQYIN